MGARHRPRHLGGPSRGLDGGPGGGISQMQKVAALCEAHHVPMAPWGLTAHVHGAASVAFFLIHEGYDYQLPEGVAHKTVCVAAGGAGIGGEIDEERGAGERDGSGADY